VSPTVAAPSDETPFSSRSSRSGSVRELGCVLQLGGQCPPELLARPVETRAGGGRGDAQHARDTARRKAVPVGQHEHFALAIGQLVEGVEQGLTLIPVCARIRLRARRLGREPLLERLRPRGRAAMVRKALARGVEQPRERVCGQLIEAAPGGEKRVGDDVVDRVGRGPPRGEAPHGRVVGAEQRGEERRAIAAGGNAMSRR
jgi:hypothetical protein